MIRYGHFVRKIKFVKIRGVENVEQKKCRGY